MGLIKTIAVGVVIWILLSVIVVMFNYGAHMNDDETEDFEQKNKNEHREE